MELSVISFNILCCDGPNGNSILQRAPRLKTVIEPLNADLIGLQEASPQWIELLNQDYGEDYEIYHVYRGRNSHEATPIAWKRKRFLCLDRGTLWFSDTPEVESLGWDNQYHCPRIFSWAKLRDRSTGTVFCFINTHFGFGDECQRKSVEILSSFARRMECPCVITGDFNMEIDSIGYRKMTENFTDVNAQTVNDLTATFHGFDPNYKGEHIDYCFVSQDIRPITFRIMREQPGGRYPSDHYGLFAVLAL